MRLLKAFVRLVLSVVVIIFIIKFLALVVLIVALGPRIGVY